MSSKKAHKDEAVVAVNRSGQHGLIIRSEKLSLPWADRFVVVDGADKSKVLDDCCGYGYQTRDQASRAWEKSGDYVQQRSAPGTGSKTGNQRGNLNEGDRLRRAARWLKTNHKLSSEIADLIDFSTKSHLAVKAEDVQELLMQNDIVADLSFAADLLETVSAQTISGSRWHQRSAHGTGRRYSHA